MKNIYLYCTLAAVILLCCNCNRKSTQSFKRSPINKISNIVLPITLHQDSLSKLINDRVPKILYNDAQKKNSNSKDLELKFTRTGNLVADFSGKNIFYQSPIKIWGKKKWLLGNVEIQAEINLYFKTELDVSSNWDLNTVTELVKYEWIKKPELILGKMDISLGFLSDLIIKHAKDEVTRKLDGALKENFDLHSTIQDVWSKIQKPVKAIQAHGVWLDLDPKSVGLMPFTKKEKWIKTGLQLQSMFKAYIADDPSLDTIQKTLPPFQWTEIRDNQTNLFLSSEIELEEAQRILRKEVKGERIKFRKKTIRVEDVFLSAEGHLLKVDLITSGDYTGTLSVKGKPDYDQEEGTMQVLDLEYDLSTDNFWLKTASFLFRKQILKQIKSQLKIPLKDNLQSLLKNLNKQINSFKYTEHLKVKGEVEHLEVFKASVLNNAIQLDFGVQADFEMIWDKNRS